jgi:hypothetical protein
VAKKPTYRSLETSVEVLGYHAFRGKLRSGKTRLIVASAKQGENYGGRSFWFTKVKSGWIVGFWGGKIYRIGEGQLVALARVFLTGSSPAGEVEAQVADAHRLKLIKSGRLPI